MARKPPPPQLPPRGDAALSHLLYYHPHLRDLSDVCEVMSPYVMQNGSFLLRNSSKRKDTYTVSVMHDKSIKHFYIFRRDHCFYLQDHYFATIDKLISYYQNEDVPNMEGIRHIRLLHPIKNPHAMVSPDSLKPYTASNGKDAKKEKKPSRFFLSLSRKKDDYANINGAPTPPEKPNGVESRPIPAPRVRSRSERAPPPLPTPPLDDQKMYYSSVHDQDISRIPALMNMLQVDDREKCDCGLYLDEAELPRDWTMHLSHERTTEGRVFFMGPDQQTAWNLPLEVACELSQEQQDRIRILLEKYERSKMRPPETDAHLRTFSASNEAGKLNEASGFSTSAPSTFDSPEYLTGGNFRDQDEFSQYPR